MQEMSKPARFDVDGITLAYVGECDIDLSSNDKAVMSMQLGLAGYTDGVPMARVSFRSAVPAVGRELDVKDIILGHQTKKISIRMASKTIVIQGRFMSCREKSGVDSTNEIDGSFEGLVLMNR